ncbi:MAG TPA: radical SAM protein, partial [Thermoleophilia bacterium]|nr:radical SAM protein [Thermoleophilia bacterium]
FRFPPLGVAYLASALSAAGHAAEILDCTFLDRHEALARALEARAGIVGISCTATLVEHSLWFADRLRGSCGLLVAGGPMPTCEPETFLPHVDLVVVGEGERTICDVAAAFDAGDDPARIAGVVTAGTQPTGASVDGRGGGGSGSPLPPPPRPFVDDLDTLPFPARDLLPNADYLAFGRRRYGFAVTTVMSTRGCPFDCEFCSNVVFGRSYRERSPGNVVDEIEQALALGYDRVSFADDVFTLRRERVIAICDEITRRDLRFEWECLGRVDSLDEPTARRMRAAGCQRIFFGIESGSDLVLGLMRKGITVDQARAAVAAAHDAGLEVGAFFILFYPGETDETVLDTLRLARSLPLDYVGLTMPYPLPGTDLVERLGDRRRRRWRQQAGLLLDHTLTFDADVSALKLRFALLKGHAEFELRRRLGPAGPWALQAFTPASDRLLRLLR